MVFIIITMMVTSPMFVHETASLAYWLRHPPREQKIPGSNPACARIFPGWSHTSDLKIGTQVATLPGACCYRVSAGTGQPGVSILWLGEMESFVRNFCLSVASPLLLLSYLSVKMLPSLVFQQWYGHFQNIVLWALLSQLGKVVLQCQTFVKAQVLLVLYT